MADTFDKEDRVAMIQRTLGLRHKLKVHESMKLPDSHEDLAIMLMAKWEFEDELHAIEELLTDDRRINIQNKKAELIKSFKAGGHMPKKKTK